MKKMFMIGAMALALVACSTSRKAVTSNAVSFPELNQNGKTAIAAHRGFWKNADAVDSQNSIASLSLAQKNHFWGSECDIHLTSDGKIIVNHDPEIDGLKISQNTFETLSAHLLPNGERRPSFDEYLDQTKMEPKTVLVIEFKKQGSNERDEELVQKTLQTLKAHKLYDPSKVAFISFSYYSCKRIADLAPQFVNQYLNGDVSPSHLAADGINGLDYYYKILALRPDWVKEAHDLGMSVNVWTVNKEKDMKKFIEMGVDAITTNEPLLLRSILGDKEYAN